MVGLLCVVCWHGLGGGAFENRCADPNKANEKMGEMYINFLDLRRPLAQPLSFPSLPLIKMVDFKKPSLKPLYKKDRMPRINQSCL